jgi:hypothetical protein
MSNTPSFKDFGKRRPPSLLPPRQQPAKRSGHVALLVMGTIAVGTTAYTLMPHQRCDPPPAGTTDQAQTSPNCSSSSSGGHGSSHGWSRSSFFSGDSSSHSSSTTSSPSVSRGGFGSFAHAFGSSGGG